MRPNSCNLSCFSPTLSLVSILSCFHRYEFNFKSGRYVRWCDRSKRPCSAGGDSPNAGPTKSLLRDCKEPDRFAAACSSDLDDVPISLQDVVDTNDHVDIGVGVPRYAEVGYHGSDAVL